MKSIPLRDIQAACVDRGEGVPLVLVHGFPLDHAMWEGQIAGLARQQGDLLVGEAYMPAQGDRKLTQPRCRVIVPDLRGFGRSPLGSDRDDDETTMERFADDLAEMLDALTIREPIVLGGLSMGGYIALQFWRKYADRLRGLIFCDTRAVADSPEAAAGRRATADRVLREGPGLLTASMLPRLFSPTSSKRNPPMVETIRNVMAAGDPRGLAAAMRGMAARPDMTASLAEIRCRRLCSSAKTTCSRRRRRCERWPRRSPARSSWKFPMQGIWPRWRTPPA
jgi:3-oxoadipate enol-lactonase